LITSKQFFIFINKTNIPMTITIIFNVE
jgi:hypothetical protein